MRIIKLVFLLLSFRILLLGSAFSFGASGVPVETIRVTGNEFPESYSFSNVDIDVLLENVSSSAIDIERISARRKGPSVSFNGMKLSPGKTIRAKVSIPLGVASGQTAFYFDIYARGKDKPEASFAVRGFVDWIVNPVPLTIDLGAVPLNGKFERTVPISVRPGKIVKLVKVKSTSPHFDIDIVSDGAAFRIHARESAEWTTFDEEIFLETDSPEQPLVSARLKGQARGAVIPSQDPVDFGLVRLGSSSEQIVRLTGVPGEPLNVGKVDFSGTTLEAFKESCIPLSVDCQALRLRLSPIVQRGPIFGRVTVQLPEYNRKLTIQYTGIAIGKETQIRSFDEDLKASSGQEASVSSLLKSGILDLKPVEAAIPMGSGPLITWQVANEQEVYGYEVYRSSGGPTRDFSRINDRIIAKLAEGDGRGSIYRWRDVSAISGNTYWYYVGLVYLNGSKEGFTGPQKVIAK